MGKAGKWLRSFLMGKKEREKCPSNVSCYSVGSENPGTPLSTIPKEKRRWSFRRSSALAASPKDSTHMDSMTTAMAQIRFEAENEQKRHDLAAEAAEAAVAAAQAAAAMIRLTSGHGKASLIQEVAATKIQSFFRSYLARKALRALRGLVKLQALARGHLVRKQATATLRCMQALFTAQARARANRIQMAEDPKPGNQRPSVHRKSTQDDLYRPAYNEIDGNMEENIKIVEMDIGEPNRSSKGRNSYLKMSQIEGANHRFSTQNAHINKESYNFSPDPSALTDISPNACSGHFEDYSFDTAQMSAHYYSAVSKPDPSRAPFGFPRSEYAESESYDYPFFPNYMANTESSRAKVRSQSAPKTRPDSLERQPSRRKRSVDGRNIPRAVRMQRSSSQVSSVAQNYQYPWSIKLNKSTVSECGSTRSAVTNLNYSRSVVTNEVPGNMY